MILALPGFPVVAQDSYTIFGFAPLGLGLRPDAQGKVNVIVKNNQNLYGLEFQLSFDPNIVEVIDANPDEEGVQIKPADMWKDGFLASNKVDNRNGLIDFAATLLRPALPASGDRIIATITFAARESGTSALNVESAILSTRNAKTISFLKQDGKIGVNPNGIAPDMHANASSTGPNPGRLLLAGAAMLALITALGVFVYALRHKK
jgi:hypothetical protein